MSAPAPFAAFVKDTAPLSLAELIDRAHEARQSASDALMDPAWRPDLPEAAQLAYEARSDAADEEAYRTREALMDRLLSMGVTTALANKLGEVL